MTSSPLPTFTARTVAGRGRGRLIGIPTINLQLADVPQTMQQGIYACTVSWQGVKDLKAVVHYGPRPVFQDSISFEVHLLEKQIEGAPEQMTITLWQCLREVRDFPSVDALKQQIALDIAQARSALERRPR